MEGPSSPTRACCRAVPMGPVTRGRPGHSLAGAAGPAPGSHSRNHLSSPNLCSLTSEMGETLSSALPWRRERCRLSGGPVEGSLRVGEGKGEPLGGQGPGRKQGGPHPLLWSRETARPSPRVAGKGGPGRPAVLCPCAVSKARKGHPHEAQSHGDSCDPMSLSHPANFDHS